MTNILKEDTTKRADEYTSTLNDNGLMMLLRYQHN
jgi:hypothetical protein